MKTTKILLILTIVTTAGVLFLALLWWPEETTRPENNFLDDFDGLEVKSIVNDPAGVNANSRKVAETGIRFRRTSLKVGDRFPFRKTITQRVLQDRLNGTYRSTTTVDIEMNLRVVELLPDDTIHWSVDFPRVKYRREQPEGTVEYDSTVSSGNHPPEANVYAGLTYSGFHFRQNTRNGSFEIDHLDAFLKRVLRFLPPIQQNVLMQNYRSQTPENIIALFIDDSLSHAISMLDKQTGETLEWTKDDFDPVPFRQRTVITVSAKQDRKTSVAIRGRVIPVSYSSALQRQQFQCSIIGGLAEGFFLVDDSSGLPEKKTMHREIEMQVSLPDGNRVFQTQISHQEFERLPTKVRIVKTQ